MPKQRGFVETIIAVFVLTLGIVGLYFYYQNTPHQKPNAPAVSTAEPSASPAQTLTYKNNYFEISYPDNWKQYIRTYDNWIHFDCGCEAFDWFDVEFIPTNLTPENWWNQLGKTVFNGQKGLNDKTHPTAFIINSTSNQKIGDNIFLEVKASDKPPATPPDIHPIAPNLTDFRVLIMQAKNGLVVITTYDTGETDLFSQIVGSLKVTTESTTMCTQEAKLCPDGSYVSRTGPKCEFAACPATKASPAPNL